MFYLFSYSRRILCMHINIFIINSKIVALLFLSPKYANTTSVYNFNRPQSYKVYKHVNRKWVDGNLRKIYNRVCSIIKLYNTPYP